MATDMTLTWVDFSAEKTRTKVYLSDVAADGSNWAALAAQTTGAHDVVKAAMAAITRLNHVTTKFSIEVEQSIPSIPADAMAQRELAVRWTYVDNVTGDYGSFHTYGPIDALLQSGTDTIDIVANVAAAAFITIVEPILVSRAGNAVTIVGARLVGRNT
jgi:hypothetical protein